MHSSALIIPRKRQYSTLVEKIILKFRDLGLPGHNSPSVPYPFGCSLQHYAQMRSIEASFAPGLPKITAHLGAPVLRAAQASWCCRRLFPASHACTGKVRPISCRADSFSR